jgi:hypothetical protein
MTYVCSGEGVGLERGKHSKAKEKKRRSHVWGVATVLVLVLAFGWIAADTLLGSGNVHEDEQTVERNRHLLTQMEERTPPDIVGLNQALQAGGSSVAPPEEGGSSVAPPEVGGSSVAPPEVGGSSVAPPEEGNSSVAPPEEGGASSVAPPEEGGTSSVAPPEVDPLQEEREKILTMDRPKKSDLLRRYQGCAIVGDSIVEAATEFQFLNTSIVFGKIGCSVIHADELIASMEAMYPRKVFVAFGLNDMEIYQADVARFIDCYKQALIGIQKTLPSAELYVVAVLPVEDNAIARTPALDNVEAYNKGIAALCQEIGVTYLDPSFILTEQPELYEPDGIHPKANFYYQYFAFLADMAGLPE